MTESLYVISDLHMCAGEDSEGMEDFKQDEVFKDWLSSMDPGTTGLIINGDFIDFVQCPPFDFADVPSYLLWDEETSFNKMLKCMNAHPAVFDAIKGFLQGGGQLDILVGNHDLDLAWDKVQRGIRDRVSGDSGNLRFHKNHLVVERVWVEHGNQFSPENAVYDPYDFIHEYPSEGSAKNQYLERVWGTDFMIEFYNGLEKDFPYADNVKPMLYLTWQALKKKWISPRLLLSFIRFIKRSGIPWEAIGSVVLEDSEKTTSNLLEGVKYEPRVEIDNLLIEDSEFRAEFEKLVKEMPAKNWASLNKPDDELMKSLADENEKAVTLGIFREPREIRAARDRLSKPGVEAVVFGHTHDHISESEGDLLGRHFNTGSWIPHMNLRDERVKERIKEEGGITKEMLADDSLYTTELKAFLIHKDATVDFELVDVA